jgi:hypothetical protein
VKVGKVVAAEEERVGLVLELNRTEEALKIESRDCPLIFRR